MSHRQNEPVDRDDFTAIPPATVTDWHRAEAQRLHDEYDLNDWHLRTED